MPKKLSVPLAGKSRKIKLQISSLVHAQIVMDVEDYALRSASELFTLLCRQGIQTLPKSLSASKDDDSMPQETISFTLPPPVAEPFVEACMARSIGAAAAVRYLLNAYASLSRSKREEMVRCEEVEWLKRAIKKGLKVELLYRGVRQSLEPCFLTHSQGMARSYLVAYDTKKKDFRCLRLAYISKVEVLRKEVSYSQDVRLDVRAKDLRKHFDPFLSFGHQVRVRLTEAGAEQMRRAVTNRPTGDIDSLKAGEFHFQCSPLQAQLYFAAFLDEAEILEPASLRDWFRKKMRKAASLYN